MIGNYLASPRHNRNVWQALAERLPSVGWEVIITSSREIQVLRLMDMLWTVFKQRENYDLAQIDVFSGKAFVFAESCATLLRFLGKKYVLTLHGGGLPEFSSRHPKRVASLLMSANKVVTPSHFLQEALKNISSDIAYIPNAIEISDSLYRQRSSLSPRLIWVRAFHHIYNPALAIRVLNLVIKEFPDAFLTMVGPDKGDGSLSQVQALVEHLRLSDHVKIIQGVSNEAIPGLLDTSDIFLNTTNYDTAPRSLLEAMGNGLCVVSTNVGGLPWLILDRIDGLLVPPQDEMAMAAAVIFLLKTPELAAHISLNARHKAEDHDWAEILPQWGELLNHMLSGPDGKVR